MTPNLIVFICHTYLTTGYDMVTVECTDSEKSEGHRTSKQIREPLVKGIVAYSATQVINF